MQANLFLGNTVSIHMQERNHRNFLGEAEPMGGHNLPPPVEMVYVSENLAKAAALPALPLITPLSHLS